MSKALDQTFITRTDILGLSHDGKVGVLAKAIAAGGVVDPKNGALRLKVAVQFTPHGDGGIDVSVWPGALREKLRSKEDTIWLGFEPADSPAAAKLPAKPFKCTHVAKIFEADYVGHNKPVKNLAHVQELWQKAIVTFDNDLHPEEKKLWNALATALKRSTNGGRWVTKIGEEGGAADATHVVKNILVNEHRDQAVHLEVVRARETIDSITCVQAKRETAIIAALSQAREASLAKLDKALQDPPPTSAYDEEYGKKLLNWARAREIKLLEDSWAITAKKESQDLFNAAKEKLNGGGAAGGQAANGGKHPADIEDFTELCTRMQSSLDSHAYTTWRNPSRDPTGTDGRAAPKPEPPPPADGIGSEFKDLVLQRFYNMQSTPSLSRFFLLTVDAEFSPAANEFADGLYWLTVTSEPFDQAKPTIRTLARLKTIESKGVRHISFWPAQRGELESKNFVADQQHGVQVIGGRLGVETPRYDITSLDVRAAAEHALEKSRRRAAVGVDVVAKTAAPDERPLPTSQRETFASAGLSLLDGDRLGAVVRRLAAREVLNQKTETVDLDADDLLTGYVVDVAVGTRTKPAGGGGALKANWRPLMNRKVEFGANETKLHGILTGLTGKLGSPERSQLDAAYIAPNLKFNQQPKAESGDESDEVDAVAEQIIATWDGGPMGVDCAGTELDKEDNSGLPFDQTVDLPRDSDKGLSAEQLVPLLRFGRAYRIGMRSVFQGGVGPDLASAAAIYDAVVDAAYPPLTAAGLATLSFKRHLRHDRIGPPHVLLPVSRAFTDSGHMGLETAKHAIVRSVRNADGGMPPAELAWPQRAVRYVFAPSVPQDLAKSHAAFDRSDKIASTLPNLATGEKPNTFPALVNVMGKGLNGEPYIKRRELVMEPAGPSEGIFATVASFAGVPPEKFFPDPNARHYVVAVRYAGTATYLPGEIISAPVLQPAGGKPAYPLRIVVERGPDASDGTAKAKSILSGPVLATAYEVPPTKKPAYSGASHVAVQEITATLAPGDDLEIDIWCMPDAPALVDSFAVTEMIAALALRKGMCVKLAPDGSCEKKEGMEAFWLGLKALFKHDGACTQAIAEPQSGFAEESWAPFAGAGGMIVPDKKAIEQVAAVIVKHMASKPLTEISSVTTLRVTHATNAPVLEPLFPSCPQPPQEKECKPVASADAAGAAAAKPATPECRPLVARRLTRTAIDRLSKLEAERRYQTYFLPGLMAEMHYEHQGASDYALAGTVEIDTDSSSSFRVHAETAFPRSPVLDDPARRRSAIDRRQGTWPIEQRRELGPDGKPTGSLKIAGYYLPPAAIYGFHVYEDGTVELPRTKVTLLTVTNLAGSHQAADQATRNGRESIQLEQLYGIIDASGVYKAQGDKSASEDGKKVPALLKGATVKLEHAFPDGKARRLSLELESISRHAYLMSQAAHQDDDTGQAVPAKPLPDAFDSLKTATAAEVWLDATVRPSKPETRSPFPEFRWERREEKGSKAGSNSFWRKTVTRRSAVRIPLKRGWFSSGEEERLGIVLWPPNLFREKTADLAKNEVRYEQPWGIGNSTCAETRPLRLDDFSDEDLGPGGRFVSRWGGDPIRGSSGGITGNFIPPGQFADYKAGAAGDAPLLAEAVEMPITRVTEGADGGQALPPEFMTVSLLAYVPKFKVDAEEWYVDVNMIVGDAPDPFVRLGLVRFQEHAPKYLKVSEPVVEWAQLLPDREATVSLSMDTRLNVNVKVKGLASIGVGVAKTELESFNKAYQYPVMRVQLVAEQQAEGRLERHVLEDTIVDNLNHKEHWIDNAHSVWSKNLTIAPADIVDGRQFYVTVEEVDMRPRASYDKEPVPLLASASPGADDYLESGTRFDVRIDLPLDLPLPKTESRMP